MLRAQLLGSPVDCLTMDKAVQRVCSFVQDGRPHAVVVTNANKYWLMARDPRLRDFVRRADLILPEYAVVWAARRLGQRLHHVGGISLLQMLLPVMAERGYRPFFLGARREVVGRLADELGQRFPRLQIAGSHHGYFGADDSVQSLIRKTRPDILFVALGSPRQEYWIEENIHRLGTPVCFGVGGSFDVLAGIKSDAPSWARSHGLEWLYRLAQDPKAYWRRYLITNSWFVWQVLKARVGCARST